MAVLQFELDRQRAKAFPNATGFKEGQAGWKWRTLLIAALEDTINNGGTFIVVASDDKIIAVQHEEEHDLDGEE